MCRHRLQLASRCFSPTGSALWPPRTTAQVMSRTSARTFETSSASEERQGNDWFWLAAVEGPFNVFVPYGQSFNLTHTSLSSGALYLLADAAPNVNVTESSDGHFSSAFFTAYGNGLPAKLRLGKVHCFNAKSADTIQGSVVSLTRWQCRAEPTDFMRDRHLSDPLRRPCTGHAHGGRLLFVAPAPAAAATKCCRPPGGRRQPCCCSRGRLDRGRRSADASRCARVHRLPGRPARTPGPRSRTCRGGPAGLRAQNAILSMRVVLVPIKLFM